MSGALPRIAVIGLGNMGLRHVRIVAGSDRAALSAVVDVNPTTLELATKEFGVPGYGSLDELFEHETLDAAIICTPDGLHVEPSLECFDRGLPVLLEKPIATTMADAQVIAQAAEDAGLPLVVGHCLRYDAKYVLLKQRIDNGDLGEILSVTTRRQNRQSLQEILRGRVTSPMFLGVHDYDIINWYLDAKPESVNAAAVRKLMPSKGFEIDDITYATFRYEGGLVGQTETGWLLPDSYPVGFHFELDVFGTRGTAHLEYFDEGIYVSGATWEQPTLGDRLTPQLHHFLDCAAGRAEPLTGATPSILAMQMALAVDDSARSLRTVSLASTDAPNT